MKKFKGKALYSPTGAAGEYSYWGSNTHIGCTHDCTYCYCKKGFLGTVMGKPVVTLKKCFKNDNHAIEVFKKELMLNIDSVREHGVFFSFTTDPLLKEVWNVTWANVMFCNQNKVPVKILTKRADWVYSFIEWIDKSNSDNAELKWRKLIAFGFTLTGHDELEPGASTNAERIEAMKNLHKAGFKTFASIEPIIDIKSSCEMIDASKDFCDLYKVGLLSGAKYNSFELLHIIIYLSVLKPKVYIKESIRKVLSGYIHPSDNFVERDYNLFK